ncbi:hypothetical protein CU103_22645 [Phyllobacterium sophorae]|uniref:DUF982 domain-containing protein n=1 Tax=Phyllobacterium sophorae TaxID=1520277 RepID=A0A2P7B586_9HYPH|nr:hypothetical protein CU103_22645 [Phyllobacterium sophorae]
MLGGGSGRMARHVLAKKLIEARQACRDALAGRITCTKARSAFIEAAREADIYIDHKRL